MVYDTDVSCYTFGTRLVTIVLAFLHKTNTIAGCKNTYFGRIRNKEFIACYKIVESASCMFLLEFPKVLPQPSSCPLSV